jgi:hypothetical protein
MADEANESRVDLYGNRVVAALSWILQLWITQASFALTPRLFDFSPNFYVAAQMFRQGYRHQLYDLVLQRAFQVRYLQSEGVVFCYPSLVAVIYSPTSLFTLVQGHLLWSVISIALFMLCAFVLTRVLALNKDWLVVFGLFSAFLPVYFHLLQGQVDVFVLAAFLLGFWAMKNGRDGLAGLALALGLIKFQVMLPFMLILLLRKRWRVVAGFALGAAVFFASCVIISGIRELAGYARLLTRLNNIPNAVVAPGMMANLRGLLYLVVGREASLLLLMLLSFALSFWAAHNWFDLETGFSLAMIVSLLVSYHTNPHSLILLIVPLAVLAKRIQDVGWNSMEGAVFLLVSSPVLIVLSLFARRFALMAIPIFALGWVMSRRAAARPVAPTPQRLPVAIL